MRRATYGRLRRPSPRRGKPRRPEGEGGHRAGRPWRGGRGRGGARPMPPRRLRSGVHSRARALEKRSWLSRWSRVSRAAAGRKAGRCSRKTCFAPVCCKCLVNSIPSPGTRRALVKRDAVLMFPPPPPPYFADPLSPAVAHCLTSSASSAPPPYNSVFSDGAQFADDGRTAAVRDDETIYTISGCSSPLVIPPVQFFFSEPPPGYEEKASVESNECSLSSSVSSSSVVTTETSS
ncbi:transmembrane protein 171 isoform X2 [Phasianus colchicus]|uniref:transmembrane protein 171 isoform X2 n=1 Tax=Phasianus colchicus TaxID=9054 RepID=UPI00129D38B4|nr:transmembrane protein 171 isoform X2 [Phasianus colchicus]